MATIDLPYGNGFLSLPFDETRFSVLDRSHSESGPLTDVEIGEALDSPIDSPSLDQLLNPEDSVLIVVSDATRATASAQIVNLLVRRIIQFGVSPSQIAIIFATGIHRPVTVDEKRELLTPFIFQRIRTIDHDANDSGALFDAGMTSRGTRVQLNKALREFDHTIVIGGIGFHYFAGFTGGRKSICPGLASAQTIRDTHMLALDFETGGRRAGVDTGLLRGNAVHEECDEIVEIIYGARPSFGINTVVNAEGQAIQVYTGHWREAHRVGCEAYLKNHSALIPERSDVVIGSCGGAPYDINLIQAHKTLDMAARACNDGGTIILLAECADGLGRADFLKWFDRKGASALAQRLRSGYEVNGQTAWALLTKTERCHVVLISRLPPEAVKQMNMEPCARLDEALLKTPSNSTGFILPRGASVLPLTRGVVTA